MSEPLIRADAGTPAGPYHRGRGPQAAPHASLPNVRAAPDLGPPAPPYWLSLQSQTPIPAAWLLQLSGGQSAVRPEPSGRWNENSLICGCPDCGAPLTIRRWLMSADCWQCGSSVEVSAHRPF